MTADLRDLVPSATRGRPVRFQFEGDAIPSFEGEPLAVALHAAGVDTLARSPKYHRPRGFFCLDGHCASCLVRVDGRPNQRACRVGAREDLRCERQNAFPSADVDLLAAADWLFPDGMDHHTMMTGTRAGNALFLKLVREMGGSGTLPDAPAPHRLVPVDRAIDVCVVGGGPAGLAAARAAAEAAPGAQVVLYDEQPHLGGSWLAEPTGAAQAAEAVAAARAAGAELNAGATAIGFFPEDGPAGLLAVVVRDRLVRVSARRIVYATGSYDQNLPFPDNDRPGVVSARACGRLAFHWGVRPVAPDRRVIVLDGAPTAATLASGLTAAGVACETVDLSRETVAGVRGARRLRGLDVEADGARRAVAGDLVAVATVPAPASELPRQHGVAVEFDPARGGFAARATDDGVTDAPGVFACGDVTGYVGPQPAAPRRRPRRARRPPPLCWRPWRSGLAGAGRVRAVAAAAGRRRHRRPRQRPATPSSRRRSPRRRPSRRTPPATRARRCADRSSTPPGARSATSTSTRPWAAWTGTPCAPSTSRWPSAPRRTPRFTAC